MQSEIDQFLQHIITERQLSSHTYSNYQRDLTRMLSWCQGQSIGQWHELQNIQIRVFVGELKKSGLSGRSIQRTLSALRTFFHFLIREGVCGEQPLS